MKTKAEGENWLINPTYLLLQKNCSWAQATALFINPPEALSPECENIKQGMPMRCEIKKRITNKVEPVKYSKNFLLLLKLAISMENKSYILTCLPLMLSFSGSDPLKYARLPSFLAFFNSSIWIFFVRSSYILCPVSLGFRLHLSTRSRSENLRKREMIILSLPFSSLG